MILLLALKVALLVTVSGLLVFIADYTRMTRGAAWKDAIGFTIIIESLFLIGTLSPLLLAAFFHLSVLGNEIGSWVLIGSLFAAGAVMYWRLVIFEQIYRRGRKARRAAESVNGEDPGEDEAQPELAEGGQP